MKTEQPTVAPKTSDELLRDLQAIAADAEKLLGLTLSECANESGELLRERFAAAQKRLSEVYSGASIRLHVGLKRTDETVRAHPYETVALALGVGALLGVLLHRNRPAR